MSSVKKDGHAPTCRNMKIVCFYFSQNVDVAFVLERLLSTMASLGGAKDLFTKVNKKK